MQCPKCGSEGNGNFCPQCGTPLTPPPMTRCPHCGAMSSTKYCPECGALKYTSATPSNIPENNQETSLPLSGKKHGYGFAILFGILGCILLLIIASVIDERSAASHSEPASPSSFAAVSSAPPESVSEVSLYDKARTAFEAIGCSQVNLCHQVDDWAGGECYELIFDGRTFLAYFEDGEVRSIRCVEEGNEIYYDQGEVVKYADLSKGLETITIPVISGSSMKALIPTMDQFELPEAGRKDYRGGYLYSAQTDLYSYTITTDADSQISSAQFFAFDNDGADFLPQCAALFGGEEAAAWVSSNLAGSAEVTFGDVTYNLYPGNRGPILEVYAPGYMDYLSQVSDLLH